MRALGACSRTTRVAADARPAMCPSARMTSTANVAGIPRSGMYTTKPGADFGVMSRVLPTTPITVRRWRLSGNQSALNAMRLPTAS